MASSWLSDEAQESSHSRFPAGTKVAGGIQGEEMGDIVVSAGWRGGCWWLFEPVEAVFLEVCEAESWPAEVLAGWTKVHRHRQLQLHLRTERRIYKRTCQRWKIRDFINGY